MEKKPKRKKRWAVVLGYSCADCGDVVTSLYRHNFASCSCGHLSVDGGQEYIRIVGGPPKHLIELRVLSPIKIDNREIYIKKLKEKLQNGKVVY